ncbi:hypothetical protein [Actinomadura hibisca]|uniref:hypothetical protein n=1 Tax=Actinomadura hibisca TaxID=68565 RepID=UPI000ADEBC0F|nr:hypothetical protein [Actinomadura hibisca]
MRFAAERPRSFVVATPGGAGARLVVEEELRRRGWRAVASPVGADVLVVCGEPGAELAQAIEVVWADVPGPRARVQVAAGVRREAVARALDGAAAELADVPRQWADAAERVAAGPWTPDDSGDEMSGHGGGHGGHEQGGHAAHGDMGGDGDGGHEHHMGAPGGVAMAERADDRDGLKLDVLHVPLGPVLSDWPAGLRVSLTLQGDVVQDAEVGVLGGAGDGVVEWGGLAVAHLDSIGRLLAVAGWAAAAERARILRDDVRAGVDRRVEVERFARQVGRSRTLRWMIRGLGVIDRAAVERYGLTGVAARYPGDVADRLAGRFVEARKALGGGADVELDDPAALLRVLPSLLVGAELAAARLIVASLDPDLAREPVHG